MSDDPWDHLPALDGAEPDAPAPVADEPEAVVQRLEAGAREPLNDLGNGRRFVHHFGGDFIKVPRVGWFAWRDTHWEKDADELAVRRAAHQLSDLIAREIPFLPMAPWERDTLAAAPELRERKAEIEAVKQGDRSEAQKEELADVRRRLDLVAEVESRQKTARARHRTFATTAGNSTRISNAMDEAAVSLAVPLDKMDARPLDVNTESGVLRFSVEREMEGGASPVAELARLDHAREQRLSKIMPVAYDRDAGAPTWHAFLSRILPDREIREFLKRWFGLSMTGLPMQRLVFLHGAGANGKSVLVDTVARVLGSYAATARIESLTGGNRRGGADATPDLIPLMGARMVRTSEPDEGQRLQEGLIKELTGGEPILMRALHQDFIEVRPVFKLTISGNHRPEIRGTDDGIWRRVLLVPFEVQIPEAERDPQLGERLWDERAGILNWLADGLMDFLEAGLAPPEAVQAATQEYREESDPVGVFLTSCCVVTGDAADTIRTQELGHAFDLHLIERGLSRWKPRTFTLQLAQKARSWKHPETGLGFYKGKASISQYVGIKLTDAFARRLRESPRDREGRPTGASVYGAEGDG